MKMYKIIHDIKELEKFINWLPENSEIERYYIALFARKKYNSKIKADKACIKRTIAHKRDIISKLLQLEVPFGAYKSNGENVPQDSLAVYITINTRCLKRASFSTVKGILSNIQNDNGYNPYKVSLNEIQKSSSGKFTIFDIDEKISLTDIENRVKSILGDTEYKIIETRGGYHIIIKNSKNLPKNWYPQILKTTKIDQRGDLLSPLPGTIQGNFIPRFI